MPHSIPNGIETRSPHDVVLSQSPSSAASVSLGHPDQSIAPFVSFRDENGVLPIRPVSAENHSDGRHKVYLELQDGQVYEGVSFGAPHSAAGELVFQTGMVGYPESITDPSYRGQILIITFPLVGNYGVPSRSTLDELLGDLPKHFESNEIHVAGLVVASYSGEKYSHYLAESSLGTWLKEQGIPAMYGVDTRALTKRIREHGTMLGRMLHQKAQNANGLENGDKSPLRSDFDWRTDVSSIGWINQNERNLVKDVSIRQPRKISAPASVALFHPSGRPVRVVVVDVGLKYNQLRCLLSRGLEVLVVPWDYDFPALAGKDYDGLFISNGPGDPAMLSSTVKHISTAVKEGRTPIFGICLGHQLLARAAGASTLKLSFGNRGHNIPCTNLLSGRCYITSQNHGFAVDSTTLPEGWEELFVNANDGTNEGIRHVSRPYFSVQFHPESTPGPRDTEFLFDVFIKAIMKSFKSVDALLKPVDFPGGTVEANEKLHPRVSVRKVLVLGSGGLSIGQAGEFDYSGSQAIKALKEEGIYTILINPNIATIQTSKGLADKVYFLPVNADFVRKVIKHEKPDAIYCTFGGQTALQVGIQLKDEFAELGIKVLGTPIETIITTEDRELFARSMESIGEKCAKSASATNFDEALRAAGDIKFPVIVRAAYALGGLGSGFANNEDELRALCSKAFAASPQVLIERSMKGWKEIEYEVVRDCRDNCITVCNMENFDPLGIHTGDSIVVAPSQTLSDKDYNMLRTTAVNVIRHLGVVGECNIQYALNPKSKEYCIIEVNARLSRSSALASKATGYPLAFIAAKLGLNIPLNEILNSVTKETCACFEPSLDYVVVKIPRWDLKKFTRVSTLLGSSMKSVGEVMAIGRTFEEAIQKAIRSVDFHNLGFDDISNPLMSVESELQTPSDQRMFAIAKAMADGYSVDKIWELTQIDKWFLQKLKGLSDFSKHLSNFTATSVSPGLLREAKQLGFCDRQLARYWNSNELAVRKLRAEAGIQPVVKQIDTVAAEFPAYTNYLYLTYNGTENDVDFEDNGVMVLGSGVYRIGSSVEFDWCSVRAIRTLREQGYKTVMVNYNPETVSTDYDEADRLYFENINLETVLDIYQLESASGVIISMGGQTPNNIALPLHRRGVKILGTSPEMIDTAENRYKFSRMLDRIGVDQPSWKELTSTEEAKKFCDSVGYPVLVRPSYVLSGAAMNTVYSHDDLASYLKQAVEVSREFPVVITKYIENAKEIEMDAVAKDGVMTGHFISEHVENAGVHSGDATLICPPQDLEPETIRRIEEATAKIGNALNVTGPFNIQFIAKDNEIKVIECNVRASRSSPFVSKVMGVDLIEMATKVIMDKPVQAYPTLNIPKNYVGVKAPQFSFSRLSGADPVLGVEMASTGEVACFGRDRYEAYIKATISTGFKLPEKNILLSIGSFKDKVEMLPSIRKLYELGYNLFATAGTADFLQEHGVPVKYLEILADQKDQKLEYSLTQHLANSQIDLYINLPSNNRFRRPANYMSKGYLTRRMAVDYQTPLITNVKIAKILIEAIARNYDLSIRDIDAQTSHQTIVLAGLINIAAFVPGVAHRGSHDFSLVTKASIAAGFSMIRVMPLGLDNWVTDAKSLKAAQLNAQRGPYCDFNYSIAATDTNADSIVQIKGEVGSLFIPFNHLSGNINKVAVVTAHFATWPAYKPIMTDAKTTDLASILLLASLHDRKVHVMSVTSKDDINLIVLAKSKGLKVTCDVCIYSLFLSQVEYPGCSSLPSLADQQALWEHLETIDVFSIGSLPYQLAGKEAVPTVGIADALPLLFTAVAEGRLTIEDVTKRLHDNPKAIFELHDQANTTVEIDIGRPYVLQAGPVWSPFVGRKVQGKVSRVLFQGRTSCMDGDLAPDAPKGADMSSHLLHPISPAQHPFSPAQHPFSPTITARPDSPVDRRVSLLDGGSTRRLSTSQLTRPILRTRNVDYVAEPPIPSLPSSFFHQPQAPSSVSPQLQSLLSSSPFKNRHVLSVGQYSRQDLHQLFTVAQEMRLGVKRSGVLPILQSRVLALMFFEPSTRTSGSFDAAMKRLGGQVSVINVEHSSTKKGETLQDTIRTLGCYDDVIVLRHPDDNSAAIAAKFSSVPIINGGNGSLEHPTQAFLDLFTIREELGTVNGITVTFVGDLKYGRTVHSLIKLLQYYHVTVNLVSPSSLSLPSDVRDRIISSRQLAVESETLTPKIVAESDVLYVTRVQKERFLTLDHYERVKDSFIIDNSVLKNAKSKMVVMHPLPRNNEISEEVDLDPRAAYYRQMEYGMYVRMALLALVLAP